MQDFTVTHCQLLDNGNIHKLSEGVIRRANSAKEIVGQLVEEINLESLSEVDSAESFILLPASIARKKKNSPSFKAVGPTGAVIHLTDGTCVVVTRKQL